jgi:ribosomal protein L2
MRSILVALALAVPVSAVAATPNYTHPITTIHQAKPQRVMVTFVNNTSQEREVRIGNEQYSIRNNTVFHVFIPVGTTVSVYSNQNSRVNGQQTVLVSTETEKESVFLQ